MKILKRTSLYTLLGALFLWGMFSCDTAGNVEDPDLDYFVKYYGGDGNQKGVDMLALNDGSFLLLGNYSESFDTDIYVVHADAEGEVLWEKRYRLDITSAKDIEQTNDGNYIILSDFQTTIGSTNFKLIKISPEGTMLDSVTTPNPASPANYFSRTVTPLDDGGFIVSGTTEFTRTWNTPTNPDPDLGDFFNYRFDANLDPLSDNEWSPVSPGFGGQLDVAIKTFQKPGEFYVFGYSNTILNATNPDETLGLFYFRRNTTGGESNGYFPGYTLNLNEINIEIQNVISVPPTLGEGFLVIGTSMNTLAVSDMFVAKLRSSLTFSSIQNDATLYQTIPLNRNIRGVSASNSLYGSFGYLLLGNEIRSTGASNIWLSKIDQSGNVLWSSTFGSETEEDSGAAVAELPDGKIVIFGTMGLADNQFKMALIKLNPRGELLK